MILVAFTAHVNTFFAKIIAFVTATGSVVDGNLGTVKTVVV